MARRLKEHSRTLKTYCVLLPRDEESINRQGKLEVLLLRMLTCSPSHSAVWLIPPPAGPYHSHLGFQEAGYSALLDWSYE
ncbi:hypothetical protein STEG23_030354 [Scotinomys teguina]